MDNVNVSGDGERCQREPSSSHNVRPATHLWKLGRPGCRVHFPRRDWGRDISLSTCLSHVVAGMRGVLYSGADGGKSRPGKLRQPSQLWAEEGAVGGRRASRRTSPWRLGTHLCWANWAMAGSTPGLERVQQVTETDSLFCYFSFADPSKVISDQGYSRQNLKSQVCKYYI